MAKNGPKWQMGPTFFQANNPHENKKKRALLNRILSSGYRETSDDRKFKKIKKMSKMPYIARS